MNISFIGYGNMAKAIAQKLNSLQAYSISASSPSLSEGVNADSITTYSDNSRACREADIIILSAKPKNMDSIVEEIKPILPPHCLLISIAAGLSLSWFEKRLPKHQALIRAMPNTPASIGMGATAMIANNNTNPKQKDLAYQIFSSIGIATWVSKEEDLDTYTALSGSGPAYVLLFIEALVDAAVALGLDEASAKEFALQTCDGAINLAKTSNLSVPNLRLAVTSPGGTTEAALRVLNKSLPSLVFEAMTAAKKRSHELGSV